ncbi:hypothetical protein PUNSTDRAFT_145176 [Punctularia strigosozonata HHB-11173 SS5]|uniref:uncharacterized protein n=1 Tax=Punctularia strigosozonata (strain HHB-11173) TaxID=741275 RepID=UPI000441760B|nr:uncharacterized protein PUNSTDRAFT_145176 [Punctularia strigosozonata HHB-11173 SS5]EIN06628.1 hypothetical protein PUNSTDRAFT_145176 [Punctularia strigosozonata HHB-11173 SS5]
MGTPTIALAVIFSLLAICLLAGGVAFVLRRRNRRNAEKGSRIRDVEAPRTRPFSSWTVEPQHPASRITPFGTRDASFLYAQVIPFAATRPGENMRVAKRREDGVWEFYEADAATLSSPALQDPTLPPARPSLALDPFASRLSLAASHLTRSTTYLTTSDMIPSPTSSSYTFAVKKDEKEDHYGGYSTARIEDGPPPPAYTRTHVGPDGDASADSRSS